jgi:hypothetical protein
VLSRTIESRLLPSVMATEWQPPTLDCQRQRRPSVVSEGAIEKRLISAPTTGLRALTAPWYADRAGHEQIEGIIAPRTR